MWGGREKVCSFEPGKWGVCAGKAKGGINMGVLVVRTM